MTPDEQAVIAVQVGKIEQKLDDQGSKMDAIYQSLKDDIADVKVQTTKTNGRVGSLEKGQAMVKGALAVLTLATPFLLFVLQKLADA